MQSESIQATKSASKVDYQSRNLDLLQKIKDKKLKELEDKAAQEKKDIIKRQQLRRKILEEASKNRENKLREMIDAENTPSDASRKNYRQTSNFESLPKIANEAEKCENPPGKKADFQQRYLNFLENLHQDIKSKKEIQEMERKKKEERICKFKQILGFDNVQSKIALIRTSKTAQQIDDVFSRSHSAEKLQSLIEAQLPKTNKNFKKKNEEYLEKIKRKREEEEKLKEEERKKKEKLKEKLKDYVLVKVKQNVLDGVYEDQLQRKGKNKREDEEGDEEESSEEEVQTDKKRRKMRSFPYVTDLNEWRKKNRLQANQKVFIVTGGYADLKRALRERGWVQNPDVNSPCFNLKFTLQGREIEYDKLLDFQMANHFEKNGVITTKAGLTRSLRNMMWINDCSEDTFYPKCFDLNDEDDYVGFEKHFKICKAVSILKIYADSVKQKEIVKKDRGLFNELKMRTEVALLVCQKNIEELDDIIDRKKLPKVITEKEWEILASDELNQEGLAQKKHGEWLKSIDWKFNANAKKPEKKNKEKKKSEQVTGETEEVDEQADELQQKVQQLLTDYEKRYPQYHLTGHNNIWILKPAGLSRGRGIICYNNFVEIQDHIKCKESLWIAQKYIENPLVVLKRKFDVRQWVLVTDFNPLTIWFYDQCYIRFSALDYDPKQVSNKFIHLTNNSIGVCHKSFDKSTIKGNMFFMHEFADYLRTLEATDVFEEKIKPQFKDIVKKSLMCAMDGIENRKNTHQLFGYDFMVDQNYKVWLIEVNSSPAMDYSTHVTAKLVKEVLGDIPKVIVDYQAAPKKERKHIDTGKFHRIYKGIQVPDKIMNTGINLCLQGIPMKKPRRNTSVKVPDAGNQNKKES